MFTLSVRFLDRGVDPLDHPCALFETAAEAMRFFDEEFAHIPHAQPVVTGCPCDRVVTDDHGMRRGACGVVLTADATNPSGCAHHKADR